MKKRVIGRCEGCGASVDLSGESLICGECTQQKYEEVFVHRVSFSPEFQAFKALLYGSIVLFITLFALPAFASEIPEDLAVKCILGEASNQGERGMQAVGEVLRRRGSTKGLYGCQNGVERKASPELRAKARKAWRASKASNITHSADHFENIDSFGVPKWARGLKPTVKLGDHTFYRVRV